MKKIILTKIYRVSSRFLRDQIQEKISKLIQRILTSRKSITINYLNPSTITKIAK